MHRFFVPPALLAGTGTMNWAPTIRSDSTQRNVGAQFIAPKNVRHNEHEQGQDNEDAIHCAPTITLPTKIAHQVRDVLHLAPGEQLILLDNSGDEVLVSVSRSSRTDVEVQVIERRPGKSESPVHIILCQGLLKSARFEWILEKGTEAGVATFAPIHCRRSMAGLENASPSKFQRWQHIIQEATEQCGRSRLPELLPIRPLLHALNDIPAGALALMPWEEEHHRTLRDVLTSHPVGDTSHYLSPREGTPSGAALNSSTIPPTPQPVIVVLFIGPEGGLMAEEVTLARRYGVQTVTLGTRILRAETAALTAVANVMYELEK